MGYWHFLVFPSVRGAELYLGGFNCFDLAPCSFLGCSFSRKNFTMPQTCCAHIPRKLFGVAAASNASIWEYCSCAIWTQSLSPAPECFSIAGKIIVAIMVGVKESLWSLNLNELTQELFEAFSLASFPPTLLHIFKPKALLSQ